MMSTLTLEAPKCNCQPWIHEHTLMTQSITTMKRFMYLERVTPLGCRECKTSNENVFQDEGWGLDNGMEKLTEAPTMKMMLLTWKDTIEEKDHKVPKKGIIFQINGRRCKAKVGKGTMEELVKAQTLKMMVLSMLDVVDDKGQEVVEKKIIFWMKGTTRYKGEQIKALGGTTCKGSKLC